MLIETFLPTTFDAWISHIFDHPVTEPAWHWRLDTEYLETSPQEEVAFLTRLFEECETVFNPYSDAQVTQGLNYLIGPSECAFSLLETEVPLTNRLHCIEAMRTLFKQYFAVRCSPHLSHLVVGATPEGYSPLNGVCYIWWDVLPLHGLVKHRPEHPDAAVLDEAIMAVIQRISQLDSIACQESTLFGLAYWQIYYPEIDEVIDEFIENHPVLWNQVRPVLRRNLFGRQ